jgi:hypothetical protein
VAARYIDREVAKQRGSPLLLALILLGLLAAAGCGGSQEPGVSAREIVDNALAAQSGATTSHMETSIKASMSGTLEGAAVNITMSGTASGDVDWANRKAKSHSEMTGTYSGMPVALTAETYAVDNYSYSRVTAFGTTDNWTRTALAATYWSTQTYVQLIDGLLQYADPELQADEQVGGVDCHVLKVKPDYQDIQEDLGQQYPEIADIPDMENLFDHLSILVWVARDTSFVTRIEIVANAHAAPGELGETASGDSVTVALTLTMEASKINEPVAIAVPAEALNASGQA